MGLTRPFPKAMVVVADDDRTTCERIVRLLVARGLTVLAVHNGQKAIDAVRTQAVDLALLDVTMPGLSGVDACKVIKSITKDQFFPVILMTSSQESRSRLQGARNAGDELLAKPFADEELLALIENMLRVKRAHDDVESAKNEIRGGSIHGQLRQLPGHRDFYDRLEHEFGKARRHLDPLACCIVAVDDFRKLISELGADVTAIVVDEVFDRLKRTIRTTDIVSRLRAGEFGVLLPNTRPARALNLTDRLISEIARTPFEVLGTRSLVAVSIGVGLYPSGRIRSACELLDAATIAVARAHVAGPNRVCLVQQEGYIFVPTVPGAA